MKSKRKPAAKPREFFVWVKVVDNGLDPTPLPSCTPGHPKCPGSLLRSADRPPIVAAMKSRAIAVGGAHYPAGVSECCDAGFLKLKADPSRHGRWGVDLGYHGSPDMRFEVAQFVGTRDEAESWYRAPEGLAWRSDAQTVALLNFAYPAFAFPGDAVAPSPCHAGSPDVRALAPAGGCPPFPPEDWGAGYRPYVTANTDLFDAAALKALIADAKGVLTVPSHDECQAVRDQLPQQPARKKLIRDLAVDLDAMAYVVNPKVPIQDKPKTLALLMLLSAGLKRPIFELKDHYSRGRPWACCEGITLAIVPGTTTFPAHPAFPSGHATFVYTLAALLGGVAGHLQPGLDQRADEVANDRVIGGFHWPSDLAAGRALAALIVPRLNASSAFRAALSAAASEWPAP